MGPINDEVVVAICALILVAVCLHYHIKVSACTCIRTCMNECVRVRVCKYLYVYVRGRMCTYACVGAY